MIRSHLLLLAMMIASPLQAGETAWQEIMPDVRMRLLSSDARTDQGKSWIALEIEMPETTKTYWRVPGETGVPPVFDFSRSTNVADARVAWPFPKRDYDQGYVDHAYYGHLVLPVEITPTGDEIDIALDVTLGICSDVCVPVSAAFYIRSRLDTPDRVSGFRIDQARAHVPVQHSGGGVIGEAFLAGETGSLRVAVEAPLDGDDVIAEISGSMALFDRPRPSPDGAWLHFDLLGRPDALSLDEASLVLSYATANGAFEVTRPLTLE